MDSERPVRDDAMQRSGETAILTSRQNGCSSTPSLSPVLHPSSTAATPTPPFQPVWRPLQPWPFPHCLLSSKLHPFQTHQNATSVLCFVMFSHRFFFLLLNLQHNLSFYSSHFYVCLFFYSLFYTICLASLIHFSFQLHLTLFLSAIYSFLPCFVGLFSLLSPLSIFSFALSSFLRPIISLRGHVHRGL